MAAQSGIKECTTKGKDSRAIALAINRVTKNRWWSPTTPNILSPIFLYNSSFFCFIIFSSNLLIDSSPTPIPEQNAPQTVKTTYSTQYITKEPPFPRILDRKDSMYDDPPLPTPPPPNSPHSQELHPVLNCANYLSHSLHIMRHPNW